MPRLRPSRRDGTGPNAIGVTSHLLSGASGAPWATTHSQTERGTSAARTAVRLQVKPGMPPS
jgi:hypothetical protein